MIKITFQSTETYYSVFKDLAAMEWCLDIKYKEGIIGYPSERVAIIGASDARVTICEVTDDGPQRHSSWLVYYDEIDTVSIIRDRHGEHHMSVPIILRYCDNCGASEERVFEDSWSGKELCLTCLIPIAPYLTNSPASEGDNLEQVLHNRNA